MSSEHRNPERITRYADFRPCYLREHRNATARRLHVLGTGAALLLLLAAVVLMNPWLLPAAVVAGYAFAWIGHALFERNKPATFRYPLWSLASDFRMFFLAVSGRLDEEYRRLQIR